MLPSENRYDRYVWYVLPKSCTGSTIAKALFCHVCETVETEALRDTYDLPKHEFSATRSDDNVTTLNSSICPIRHALLTVLHP